MGGDLNSTEPPRGDPRSWSPSSTPALTKGGFRACVLAPLISNLCPALSLLSLPASLNAQGPVLVSCCSCHGGAGDPARVMGVTRPSWGLPWGSRGLRREGGGGAGGLSSPPHWPPWVAGSRKDDSHPAQSCPQCSRRTPVSSRVGAGLELLSISLEKKVHAQSSILSTPSVQLLEEFCPGWRQVRAWSLAGTSPSPLQAWLGLPRGQLKQLQTLPGQQRQEHCGWGGKVHAWTFPRMFFPEGEKGSLEAPVMRSFLPGGSGAENSPCNSSSRRVCRRPPPAPVPLFLSLLEEFPPCRVRDESGLEKSRRRWGGCWGPPLASCWTPGRGTGAATPVGSVGSSHRAPGPQLPPRHPGHPGRGGTAGLPAPAAAPLAPSAPAGSTGAAGRCGSLPSPRLAAPRRVTSHPAATTPATVAPRPRSDIPRP